MEITKTNSKDLNHTIEFKISKDEIDKEYNQKITDYSKKLDIKGFRKGKVPTNVVEQKYGETILSEVINELAQKCADQAIKEKKLKPADTPQLNMEPFSKGQDVKCKLELEVLPEIPDVDLSKIEVTKPIAEVDNAEVEKSLKNIAEQRRTAEKINEERPLKKGDIAVIDFEGFIDDKPFEGGKGKSYHLELGSNTFIGNFEDQLVGKKPGDKLDVKVTFPKDYQAGNLANKEATFKVEIKEIREKKVPEINDQFAKDLKLKDLKELKDKVSEEIKKSYEMYSKEKMKDELMDKLNDKVKFKLPEKLVDKEFDVIWKEIQHAKEHNKLSEEDAKKSEKKLKEDYKEMAKKRVKLGLLLADISNKAEVKLTQQDIQNILTKEAMRFPGQEKQVFEFYTKNPKALESLKGPAYEEKIIDHALSKVKAKEKKVSKEKLMKI
jgi:trigger factor